MCLTTQSSDADLQAPWFLTVAVKRDRDPKSLAWVGHYSRQRAVRRAAETRLALAVAESLICLGLFRGHCRTWFVPVRVPANVIVPCTRSSRLADISSAQLHRFARGRTLDAVSLAACLNAHTARGLVERLRIDIHLRGGDTLDQGGRWGSCGSHQFEALPGPTMHEFTTAEALAGYVAAAVSRPKLAKIARSADGEPRARLRLSRQTRPDEPGSLYRSRHPARPTAAMITCLARISISHAELPCPVTIDLG